MDRVPAALFFDRGGSLAPFRRLFLQMLVAVRTTPAACSSSAIIYGSPTRLRSRPI